jgi:hypothetical protein
MWRYVTPEQLEDSRRHAARMSTQELGALYVKGPSEFPPEAWAIIEQEVQRRERAVRLAQLSSTGESSLSAGTAPGGANWVLRGALLLGFLGVLGVGYYAFLRWPRALPTCDSSSAEEAVRGAIENSVASRLVNFRLLRLQHQSQLSYNERKLTRMCKGTAILNSGDVAIRYRLYKLSATDVSFLVEVSLP